MRRRAIRLSILPPSSAIISVRCTHAIPIPNNRGPGRLRPTLLDFDADPASPAVPADHPRGGHRGSRAVPAECVAPIRGHGRRLPYHATLPLTQNRPDLATEAACTLAFRVSFALDLPQSAVLLKPELKGIRVHDYDLKPEHMLESSIVGRKRFRTICEKLTPLFQCHARLVDVARSARWV